ncbi:hypothetical protein BKA93DRAFT_818437 [Sparassis latifolia]
MRLHSLFGYVISSVAFIQLVSAQSEEFTEPAILATALFPEDNAFGQVVNGERNKIFINIENLSDRNVTIKSVAGSFHNPDSNSLVKNVSTFSGVGRVYRVTAYDSIVTIVEPEGSWFDFKLWSTFLIVAGLLSALVYYAYLVFVPQPKKRRAVPSVSAPVGTVTATGAGGYQEEWIPEHHLKKPKTKKSKSGTATSGDETSGTEMSTAKGKKRKANK